MTDSAITGGANTPTIASDSAIPPEELDRLTDDIVVALKSVYDPEIPADIYELGLIYKVDIADDRKVAIDMTLTAPGCPVAGEMPGWVETAVAAVPGVQSCAVTMVFDPPWDQRHYCQDESQVEKEESQTPQAQEKKDAGAQQINGSPPSISTHQP